MTNTAPKTSVVGLGDPIVDVLVRVSAGNFDQLGLQRGGSTSFRQCDMDSLLQQVEDGSHRAKLVSFESSISSLVPTPKLDCLAHLQCARRECRERAKGAGQPSSAAAVSQVHGHGRT